MIDIFVDNPRNFDWMMFRSSKNKHVTAIQNISGKLSLQQYLNKFIGYNLKNVKKMNPKEGYMNQLIHNTFTGKYIVQLRYGDGVNTHAVTVDCDNRVIFDCMEQYSLTLCEESFHYCGGHEGSTIASINTCFEIVDNEKKRPWRT